MVKPDKYLVEVWYNRNIREMRYGVKCRIDGKYYHVTEGTEAELFLSYEEARSKAKELELNNH